jgi:hypothetical protein
MDNATKIPLTKVWRPQVEEAFEQWKDADETEREEWLGVIREEFGAEAESELKRLIADWIATRRQVERRRPAPSALPIIKRRLSPTTSEERVRLLANTKPL